MITWPAYTNNTGSLDPTQSRGVVIPRKYTNTSAVYDFNYNSAYLKFLFCPGYNGVAGVVSSSRHDTTFYTGGSETHTHTYSFTCAITGSVGSLFSGRISDYSGTPDATEETTSWGDQYIGASTTVITPINGPADAAGTFNKSPTGFTASRGCIFFHSIQYHYHSNGPNGIFDEITDWSYIGFNTDTPTWPLSYTTHEERSGNRAEDNYSHTATRLVNIRFVMDGILYETGFLPVTSTTSKVITYNHQVYGVSSTEQVTLNFEVRPLINPAPMFSAGAWCITPGWYPTSSFPVEL